MNAVRLIVYVWEEPPSLVDLPFSRMPCVCARPSVTLGTEEGEHAGTGEQEEVIGVRRDVLRRDGLFNAQRVNDKGEIRAVRYTIKRCRLRV